MRTINFTRIIILLMIFLSLESCGRVPEIFTAGFGYGMFAALAVLVVLAYLIMKARKK